MKYYLLSFLFVFLAINCTKDKLAAPNNLAICLKYYYQPPLLSHRQDIDLGLQWVLSYLGAELSPQQWQNATSWQADILELDLGKIGFSVAAQKAWLPILRKLKNSQHYLKNGSIDIGRFVMLTLNSSHHYYALTGVDTSFRDFQNRHNLDTFPLLSLQNGQSTVTLGNRIVYQTKNKPTSLVNLAFMAKEGRGSLGQGNFVATDFEVFDFMPNGQPRFAIYDEHGRLQTAGSPSLSLAGKPAKCMWCHESSIQPNFSTTATSSILSFNQDIALKRLFLDSLRLNLNSKIDFEAEQAHSLGELLYITFAEPTASRLAAEWGYSLEQTKVLLLPYTPHRSREFPALGWVYNRAAIEHLAPLSVLPVPQSVRDYSAFEPNYQ